MRLRAAVQTLVCSIVVAHATTQSSPEPEPKWEKIDGPAATDAQGNQYFIDRNSLQHVDETIKGAILVELPAMQLRRGAEVRSIVRVARFDCQRRRLALMAIDSFSGRRGTGTAVEFIDIATDPLQWTEVESGSTDEAILDFVCAIA